MLALVLATEYGLQMAVAACDYEQHIVKTWAQVNAANFAELLQKPLARYSYDVFARGLGQFFVFSTKRLRPTTWPSSICRARPVAKRWLRCSRRATLCWYWRWPFTSTGRPLPSACICSKSPRRRPVRTASILSTSEWSQNAWLNGAKRGSWKPTSTT